MGIPCPGQVMIAFLANDILSPEQAFSAYLTKIRKDERQEIVDQDHNNVLYN
jgi:hypothetical protein